MPAPVLAVTVQVVPEPLTRVIAGEPVRPLEMRLKLPATTPVTASLNVTVHWTDARVVGVVLTRLIETTVGAVVSMTMALLAPSEPAAPGAGRVRMAAAAPFWIVPPLSARAEVEV